MSAIRSRAGEIKKAERLTDRCARCGKGPLVNDSASGEIFCSNCGYVIKEKMAELGRSGEHFLRKKRTIAPTPDLRLVWQCTTWVLLL